MTFTRFCDIAYVLMSDAHVLQTGSSWEPAPTFFHIAIFELAFSLYNKWTAAYCVSRKCTHEVWADKAHVDPIGDQGKTAFCVKHMSLLPSRL